ncbi:MAG: LdpA C-terminal domain-containing domain [Cyanobacteria bacterium P01_F01_bin.13]
MSTRHQSLEALRLGQWFKLICGASYQDVLKIRNLSLVYSLAGTDCIDVAADLSVVHAALEGIATAQSIAPGRSPWLMVSLNDGQDPHFRKAWFDLQRCPSHCDRPCERICPADAILPISPALENASVGLGVLAERCYGCGRCLPICPYGVIKEHSITRSVEEILPTLFPYIDAIEIHTQIGRQVEFQNLWRQLTPYVSQLQLVAISCPDSSPHNDAIIDYLAQVYQLMSPKPNQLLWQTDGRPMSGDIGKGTTRATIRLAQKVLNACLPGYVQLAGGTNGYTVDKLRSLNLLKTSHRFMDEAEPKAINGIAYGSYARRLVNVGDDRLEKQPKQLWQQVSLARNLVGQIKPSVYGESHISQFLRHYDQSLSIPVVAIPP